MPVSGVRHSCATWLASDAPAAVAKKREVLARLVREFFAAETLYPFIPIMGTVRNKVLPSLATELSGGRLVDQKLTVVPIIEGPNGFDLR